MSWRSSASSKSVQPRGFRRVRATILSVGAFIMVSLSAAVVSESGAENGTGRVALVNALAGQSIDVLVGGRVLVPDLGPGQVQDLTPLMGQTLRNVEIRRARSTTVVVGPLERLAVPAGQYVSWVVHEGVGGTAQFTAFEDNRNALEAGRSRLTVRHVAHVGAADVSARLGAPSVDVAAAVLSFAGLANGQQAQADVDAAAVDRLEVEPPGGGSPLLDVAPLTLRSGEEMVVYVVGGSGTPLSFFCLSNTDLTVLPTRVDSGLGALPIVAGPLGWASWPVAAVLALLSIATASVIAIALSRREHDGAAQPTAAVRP